MKDLSGMWLAARAFAPIDRLTQTARRIGAGDLHQRVPVPRAHDEIRRLALTLNEMIDHLERAFLRQRRFVADASHELRTAVTAIRSKTDREVVGRYDPLFINKFYFACLEFEIPALLQYILRNKQVCRDPSQDQDPCQRYNKSLSHPYRETSLAHGITGNDSVKLVECLCQETGQRIGIEGVQVGCKEHIDDLIAQQRMDRFSHHGQNLCGYILADQIAEPGCNAECGRTSHHTQGSTQQQTKQVILVGPEAHTHEDAQCSSIHVEQRWGRSMDDEQEVAEQGTQEQTCEHERETGQSQRKVLGHKVCRAIDATTQHQADSPATELAAKGETTQCNSDELAPAPSQGHRLPDSMTERISTAK
jgi:HAMP domain-containing protein